jgi:hypothetical protein
MPQPDEAQQLLEQHIATLDEQKSQLERALAHLKGPAGGEGRPNRGGGNTGGAQAPRGARRAEVIADLTANPGSKASEVASRVGINPNHAQTILGNLVKQGVATKEGQGFTVVAGKS